MGISALRSAMGIGITLQKSLMERYKANTVFRFWYL